MYRFLIVLAALNVTALSNPSGGLAANIDTMRFELEPRRDKPQRVQLNLRGEGEKNRGSMTGSDFEYRELGLSPASLNHEGSRPLRFALIRDAGRADCYGTSQRGRGTGQCRFTANHAFNALLARHGVAPPSQRQGFALIWVGASRGLVQAIAKARYPAPTVDELTALAALNVTPIYINELAKRGYRPDAISELTAFKALAISPSYIDGITRAGLRDIRADQLIQLRALGVTPEYVAELRRLGVQVPVSRIIQYKALGLSPRAVASSREAAR